MPGYGEDRGGGHGWAQPGRGHPGQPRPGGEDPDRVLADWRQEDWELPEYRSPGGTSRPSAGDHYSTAPPAYPHSHPGHYQPEPTDHGARGGYGAQGDYGPYGDVGGHGGHGEQMFSAGGPDTVYTDPWPGEAATEVHDQFGTSMPVAVLPWSEMGTTGDVPLAPFEEDEDNNGTGRRRTAFWLVGALLLLGGVIGGGLWWFLGEDDGGGTTELAADGNDVGTGDTDPVEDEDPVSTTAPDEVDEAETGEDDEAEDTGDGDRNADSTGTPGGGDGDGEDPEVAGGAGGTGGGDGDGGSPADAVARMFDAMQTGNCNEFAESISAHSRELILDSYDGGREAACEATLGYDEADLSLGALEVVSESGDSATVSVEVIEFGESRTDTVPVVREDGVWRVDMLGGF